MPSVRGTLSRHPQSSPALKWLIDAQLPRRLSIWLDSQGEDAVHTLDLPAGNQTTDREFSTIADDQQRILVSKDQDFLDSFLVRNTPRQLHRVSTGNISNDQLLDVFKQQLSDLRSLFASHNGIEVTGQGDEPLASCNKKACSLPPA